MSLALSVRVCRRSAQGGRRRFVQRFFASFGPRPGAPGPRKDRGSTLNRPPDQGARYAPYPLGRPARLDPPTMYRSRGVPVLGRADPAGNDDPGLVQPGAQRDAEVDHEHPQESSRDGFRHVAFLGEQAKGPDSLLNPGLSVSERGRNRTFNLWIKSPLLCQLSYAPQGAGLSTLPREFRQGGAGC